MGYVALVPKVLNNYIVVCSLAAGCALFLLFGRTTLTGQLHAWKLLPRPERLTELYFSDPTHLPATYTPGRTQSVSFTVHNFEHQTTDYRYTLTAWTPQREQALGNGHLTLGHDGRQNVTRIITVPALDRRTEIRVHLQYSGIPFGRDTASAETQAIHYWVNKATT